MVQSFYKYAIDCDWKDLDDIQIDYLKIIYCWLKDEKRMEKLFFKDPTLIQRTFRHKSLRESIKIKQRNDSMTEENKTMNETHEATLESTVQNEETTADGKFFVVLF